MCVFTADFGFLLDEPYIQGESGVGTKVNTR